jgi:hypothetical protein
MEFVIEGVVSFPRTLITVEMTAISRTATDTAKSRRGCVHATEARRRERRGAVPSR